MSDQPRLSIVLPTFNRRPRLVRVLAALDKQTVPPGTFEVVVVDDGSTDDTAEWLAKTAVNGYALRHLRQDNAGPAKARNRGVSEARGELILFIDDDVEPTPELVAEHLATHAEPDVVALGPLALAVWTTVLGLTFSIWLSAIFGMKLPAWVDACDKNIEAWDSRRRGHGGHA